MPVAHDYLHIKPQGRLERGWPCQLPLSVMAGHIAGYGALIFRGRSWKAPAENLPEAVSDVHVLTAP